MASDNPTTLISIPRDSYVPIPGHGRDKINAAFALGGGRLLTQTVELATGLHLDHYAEVGFSEFAASSTPSIRWPASIYRQAAKHLTDVQRWATSGLGPHHGPI